MSSAFERQRHHQYPRGPQQLADNLQTPARPEQCIALYAHPGPNMMRPIAHSGSMCCMLFTPDITISITITIPAIIIIIIIVGSHFTLDPTASTAQMKKMKVARRKQQMLQQLLDASDFVFYLYNQQIILL